MFGEGFCIFARQPVTELFKHDQLILTGAMGQNVPPERFTPIRAPILAPRGHATHQIVLAIGKQDPADIVELRIRERDMSLPDEVMAYPNTHLRDRKVPSQPNHPLKLFVAERRLGFHPSEKLGIGEVLDVRKLCLIRVQTMQAILPFILRELRFKCRDRENAPPNPLDGVSEPTQPGVQLDLFSRKPPFTQARTFDSFSFFRITVCRIPPFR